MAGKLDQGRDQEQYIGEVSSHLAPLLRPLERRRRSAAADVPAVDEAMDKKSENQRRADTVNKALCGRHSDISF
jgi:hypothetical protein